jgi:hypothetical protein
LLKELRAGIDYHIESSQNNDAQILNTISLETIPTELWELNTSGLCDNENGSKVESSVAQCGRKAAKISLTARGMNQFALAARTPNGQLLRDVVLFLIRGIKRLKDALDSGELQLKRRTPSESTAEGGRDLKRLKVCDTQKRLMEVVAGVSPDNASIFGRVNGETNKHVTGMYKYEIARMLKKPANKVNAWNRKKSTKTPR